MAVSKAPKAYKGKTCTAQQLKYTTLSSSSISTLPPVFTRDASYLFLPTSDSIKIYSRLTGQVVSTLSHAHRAEITAMLIHPSNPLQLVTSSVDGHVKVWDYLDGKLLKDFDLCMPITNMAGWEGMVFVTVKKARHANDQEGEDRFNSIVYSVSLTPPPTASKKGAIKPDVVRIAKTKEATAIGISPNGHWLVVIGSRKVQVARMNNLRAGFTKYVTDERLACMAFHPTDSSRLVTGDEKGRIRIWYILDQAIRSTSEQGLERHAPSTVLHWHAHKVSSLAFTENGAHLLSGGEEGVLVVWTGTSKEFVPRLGAPIVSIAVAQGLDGREAEYAVVLADGTLTFIGAMGLKTTRSFSRIKIDTSRMFSSKRSAVVDGGKEPSPLAIHPATGNLVLASGHPSSLQFYDAEKDMNAMELEIAPSNRVSRADQDPIEPTRLEIVIFSSITSDITGEKGEWMVTFDSRNLFDQESDDQDSKRKSQVISESSLKFWRWDRCTRRYLLNTRIDRPHSGKRLTSLTFSPVSNLLISTGLDGRIRSWTIYNRTLKSGRLESYWTCRSSFHYRSAIPLCSSFSPDGSLLAIGQGSFVTFWSPEANLLQMTLSCPEMRSKIMQICFAGRNGRFVILSSNKTIVTWDLVLGEVCWSRVVVGSIASLQEGVTLVMNEQGKATVETLSVHTGKALQRYEMAGLRLRTLVKKGDDLIGLSKEYDLVSISKPGQERNDGPRSIRGIEKVRKTLFDDLFGPTVLDTAIKEVVQVQPKASGGIAALFDAPSHLLPPVTALLDEFVKRILPPAPVKLEEEEEVREEKVQEEEVGEAKKVEMNDVLLADISFLSDMFRGMVTSDKPAPIAKKMASSPSTPKAKKAVESTGRKRKMV